MALDIARILAGLGPMLTAAGGPQGWAAGPMALQQGVGAYDARLDRQLREELTRQQLEDARTANQDAAAAQQRQREFLQSLGRGPMQTAAGGSGGIRSGPMNGGAIPQISPEQLGFLGAYPEAIPDVVGGQLFPKAGEAEVPTVEDFIEGGQTVQKQWDAGSNSWVEVGRGGRWQPQQAPQPPAPSDRAKRAEEAGLTPGTPEYQAFVLGSDQAAGAPKQENILRDEFNALTKDFRTVQDAYSKINATSDTGAGDMSLLYSYVKLLDPGSVVRESEFATAAASGSFGEQVQGAVQRVMTGERLPSTLRDAFKNEAKAIFKAQEAGYKRLKDSYTNLAKRTNVLPENVIVDYAAPEAPIVPSPVTPDIGFQRPVSPYKSKYGLE